MSVQPHRSLPHLQAGSFPFAALWHGYGGRWFSPQENEERNTKNMKHLKNMLALLLAFAMLMSCIAVVSADDADCPSKEFADVPVEGHWAHESIDFMIGNGYMNGTSAVEKRFSPDTTTSRAMIVQILYKMDGQPAVEGEMKFHDVAEGTWYYNAVLWANQNGITNGVSATEFKPDADVTREQIATFLYKHTKAADTYDSTAFAAFPDADQVSSWAEAALAWAVEEGVITGKGKDDMVYLDPQGLATRAEVATMNHRYAMLQQPVTSAEEFLAELDYDKAMMDAQYLVEEIGVRLTGTRAEIKGLDYLETQYKKLGYEIERQDFTLEDRTSGDISIGDMVIAAGTPSKNEAYTGFGEAKGTAVYLEDPAKAAERKDLEGKIVFFPGNCRASRGTAIHPATYEAIAALEKAGAAGIVVMMDPATEETERYQIRVSTPNFSSMSMTSAIPILVTNAMDTEKLTAYLKENDGAAVTMEARDHVDSQNLIVTKKAARETDLTLYVTCHIDSVLPSPGANDNASGIVGVLAMARAFQNVDTNYNIQFITFGAEEAGLQGARHFAGNLSEEEIAHAIGNYNLDMVATSQENCVYIFMNSSTNPEAPVNDASLETHVTRMARNAAEALDFDPEHYRTCYDRTTDHYALHLVGIPAVEFDWRANAEGTAFEDYYHTRFDDFEHNFSREKLQAQVDIISLAVYNDATADYAAVAGEGVYREYYNTVAEAVEAVEDGSVVKLLKDSSESITVSEAVAFTLDGNGYAFSGEIKAGESFELTQEGDVYTIYVPAKEPNWVSTWATAEEKNDINADRMPQLPLNGSTVRQIIRVTTSGETMKLTFSNQYGKSDVAVKSLHIAKQVQADKSTIDTATDTIVTVGGSEEFVIPAGKTIETDPVHFPVNALENVAVSMYFGSAPTNNITGHRGARATTYQISGNHVSTETFGAGTKTTLSWFFLSDVALDMPEGSRAIVCFGDSITDGYGTDASYLGKKPDCYTRWGDYFAKRLQADENTKNVAVLNEGIGANSMLGSYPTDAGKDRYARDLLEHDGVEYVIILFGVNDMEKLQNTNKYQQLITEYKKMIDLAHENDIKVYVAPVLPFGKSNYYSAASEQLRTMVNDWFRSEDANVDAIIDFESAVADPSTPTSLLPRYTSDGLHPDSGYDVMANAIDLSLFYE